MPSLKLIVQHDLRCYANYHLHNWKDDKTEYKQQADIYGEQFNHEDEASNHRVSNVITASYVDQFVQNKS